MSVIEATGLRKAFGTTVALDGIDLRVEEGRILGLIGPNGAGKSTAINAILGLTPHQGQLRVLGCDLLPLITALIIIITQGIMFLAGSAVLLGRGINATTLWPQIPLLSMWAATLYHVFTVHAFYYAPFYGWMLLASGWARRAAFLWASVPIAAVLIIEKLVFDTSVFAHVLLARLGGGPAAIPFPPPGNMPMEAPTLANLGAFLVSPGLWIGSAICALFLAAAVRLRRYQGPI